jgi:hypothetical protein
VFETSEGGRVVTAADMLASAGLTGEFFLGHYLPFFQQVSFTHFMTSSTILDFGVVDVLHRVGITSGYASHLRGTDANSFGWG